MTSFKIRRRKSVGSLQSIIHFIGSVRHQWHQHPIFLIFFCKFSFQFSVINFVIVTQTKILTTKLLSISGKEKITPIIHNQCSLVDQEFSGQADKIEKHKNQKRPIAPLDRTETP
ncbi:MAG: hypothetical protein EBU27_05630 [Opitutae bacterium]|nr:hypothetical protein [Opitutae bacterium]